MSAKEEAYKIALKSLSDSDMGWEHWEQLIHIAAEYFDEKKRRQKMEECPECGGRLREAHIATGDIQIDIYTGEHDEVYKLVLVCDDCGYVDEDYIPF